MTSAGSRTMLVAVLCILAAGCSSTPGSGGAARGSPNFIDTAEMDASGRADAFSLVQTLRPRWLRVRGPSSIRSPTVVRVYLDGSLLGGPEHLQQISTHSIGSLRYLDGREATQRWGLDHGAGAIIISTRRAPANADPGCCD